MELLVCRIPAGVAYIRIYLHWIHNPPKKHISHIWRYEAFHSLKLVQIGWLSVPTSIKKWSKHTCPFPSFRTSGFFGKETATASKARLACRLGGCSVFFSSCPVVHASSVVRIEEHNHNWPALILVFACIKDHEGACQIFFGQ